MKTLLTFVRVWIAAAALVFVWPSTVHAQTALTTTTLDAAVDAAAVAQTIVDVASATGIAVGSLIVIDREAMEVDAITGTLLTVRRGVEGTAIGAHVTASAVTVGIRERFYVNRPYGACTRTSESFLPHIVLGGAAAGESWDCPVGTNSSWALLNGSNSLTVRSEAFNLDNGAGTTVDAVLIRHPRRIHISACRIVYEDATTGTVAAGTAAVGTTVGGAEVVAATAYANAVAVGTTTAMVIVNGNIVAATPVLVRHVGVAAAQAGEAVIECDYSVR